MLLKIDGHSPSSSGRFLLSRSIARDVPPLQYEAGRNFGFAIVAVFVSLITDEIEQDVK